MNIVGRNYKSLSSLSLILIAIAFVLLIGPVEKGDLKNLGWLSIAPTSFVLLLAIITQRSLEALIGGCIFGFLLLGGIKDLEFISLLSDASLRVMANPVIGWIILVAGLMGTLIVLLELSGATQAFSTNLNKIAKGRKSTLISAWILGIIVFIDDYLNSLAVSNAMHRLCDKYKISRQMLAYVVDSTAAPMCIIIPLSTWAIYGGSLLEANGFAEKGKGLVVYTEAIPYMFYGWVAVLLVPLVSMGWIPILGSEMKKPEVLAANGKQLLENTNPSAEDLDLKSNVKNPRLWNFFIPIISLFGFTLYFEVDALKGLLASVLLTMVIYFLQKTVSVYKLLNSIEKGFVMMLMPCAIIVASFVLQEVNIAVGLTDFVIEKLTPLMSGKFLPVVAFIGLSFITFTTGSFWGTFAVAFPIVLPLAKALNSDYSLVIGAVVSAGALGSHICFYSDATVLCAKGSGCSVMSHALSQLPYAIIATVISIFLYTLFAFI